MIPGREFPGNSIHIYLDPLSIYQKDMDLLSVIYAGPNSNINQVLHEIIWDDWFSDTPITQLLPQNKTYGLLIVPRETPPWIRHYSGIDYKRELRRHTM
jgi:hypothetical protein